ncbi:hypothetical protein NDU88_000485 [Pleurodeles waltl]|uniref:Secreted protein n=1 Tax=Pleurodeles waltl TaxID=8319 RepID=A0AAV7S7M2_PLEWA|nr:hypothetical protein NDU88_000485 [Pleurodeles waltl]
MGVCASPRIALLQLHFVAGAILVRAGREPFISHRAAAHSMNWEAQLPAPSLLQVFRHCPGRRWGSLGRKDT